MSEDIIIPEAINKPPKKNTVQHPDAEQKGVKKDSTTKTNNKSRFEPEYVNVEIPSHGMLYKNITDDTNIKSGSILLKPMTLKEEKILTTPRFVKDGSALDKVLENCIKSDISQNDLLSSDRLYLLFYLRGMSYGLKYYFDVTCYHCGEIFEQEIDISKLEIREWEEEKEYEPIVITLPFSKATVEAHYMRGKDENQMLEQSKKEVSYDESDDAIGDQIVMLIDKVTLKDGEVLGPKDKVDFINNLIGSDIDFFRDEYESRDCGIQPIKNIKCPSCGRKITFNIPFGRNFFRRSR